MGLRFSLSDVNTVGHLTDGNVKSFLREASNTIDSLERSIDFIDKIVNRTHQTFYTTWEFWPDRTNDIYTLRNSWEGVKGRIRDFSPAEILDNREILEFFYSLSRILNRCDVKTLLLPGFDNMPVNQNLRDEEFLRRLVAIHPGTSTLILQIQDQFERQQVPILNAFSKFDKAYNSIDLWPGILLWNNDESLFINVESSDQVVDIFKTLKYEKDALSYLKEYAKPKKSFAYIFHMSDLHFGHSESNRRKERLTTVLERHLNELDDCSHAIPVITGDLMDTPNATNARTFEEFKELITLKGFEEPIQLLGNHDVDHGGWIKMQSQEKAIITSLIAGNQISILEELGLGFIKFDSNTGGNIAQGKIGEEQLLKIGNVLDSKPYKNLYYIALLHHHPKVIDNPDWYAKDFYEKVFGDTIFEKTMRLIDADAFLQWIEERGIDFILHGHKHIPKVHDHNAVTIVAAGSATGKVRHKDKSKTYLSYNVIKYDPESRRVVSCGIYAEDVLGGGIKNVMMQRF